MKQRKRMPRKFKQVRQKAIDDLRKQGLTLLEIGKMFGITKERVRQIELKNYEKNN